VKIVICWTDFSGYVAACWRELAAQPDIDLNVVCFEPGGAAARTGFNEKLLDGIPHRQLSATERQDSKTIAEIVAAANPDIVVVPGWTNAAYSQLTAEPRLESARFVMAMDTPYRGDFRQRVSRLVLSGFLRRIDRVVVSGERSFVYAKQLGFTERQIMKGVYAFDQQLFNAAAIDRRLARPDGWPRRFLFMGRYVPVKALDVLVSAYRVYRDAAAQPWPLDCYGMGELAPLLANQLGVTDKGFVQPADQPAVFEDHGAFILPSRYEPWGVVIAEAMATGLPAVCSTACGAAGTLVLSYYNGLEVPPDDVAALAQAMHWIDDHYVELPMLGRRAAVVAEGCSARLWATRWRHLFEDLLRERGGRV
jgi:glycosyltransferase involved in cell wall biosynthesis